MMSFFTFPSQTANVPSGNIQDFSNDPSQSEEWWAMACSHARFCIPGYPCCHPAAIQLLLMPSGTTPYVPVPSTMFSTSAFPLFSQPGTSHNFSLASPSCSLSPMVRSDSSHFDERSMCASSDISERSAEVPRVHSLDSFQRKEWPTESLKSQFFSAIRPPISITHHNRGSPTITTRDDGVLVVKIPPFRPVESPLASPMTQDISRLQSSSQSPRTEPEETESLKQSNENGKTEHSEQWKSLPSLANQAVNRSSSDTSNNLPQIIKENFLDVIEETDLTVGEIEKGKRTDSHDSEGSVFVDVVTSSRNSPISLASSMAAETLYCCKKHGQTRSNVTPNLQASSLLLGWDCVGSTTNNGYKIPYWAVNMNVREFEMRMQLANLQERYREKQRELAMLRCSQKAEKRHTAKSSDFAHSHTKRSSQSHRSISSSYSMIRRQRSMSLCSAERTGEKRELKMKISIEKTTLSTDVSTACSKAPKSVEKRSHTAIRISKLSKDKLIDGARLLYLENGLLYPGTLQVIEPPDVYGLEFDGVGGPEPHILCEEELLEKGVLEVKLKSTDTVESGTRVCGPWRGRLIALYPGVVVKEEEEGSSLSQRPKVPKAERNSLIVDFDDGDSGIVCSSEIRLLPADYPTTKVTSSVLPEFLCRRKRPNESRTRSSQNKTSTKKIRTNAGKHDKSHLFEWKWVDSAPIRSNTKSKVGKIFYNSVRKGIQLVKVGDCVSFHPTNVESRPYVGIVQKMWEIRGTKYLRVSWCYRIDEVVDQSGRNLDVPFAEFALFRSSHVDDNLVETIESGCELLPFAEFGARHVSFIERLDDQYDPSGVQFHFYDAGIYDPISKKVEINREVQQLIK